MNKQHNDGLEWLRKIRQLIAAECGGEIHAINEKHRAAAAGIPHRSYRDGSSSKRIKPKGLAHG
jgi:hypothetical protein